MGSVADERSVGGRALDDDVAVGEQPAEEGKPLARCSTIAVSQKPFCGRSVSGAAARAAAHRRCARAAGAVKSRAAAALPFRPDCAHNITAVCERTSTSPHISPPPAAAAFRQPCRTNACARALACTVQQ